MLTVTDTAQTRFLDVIEKQGRDDLAVFVRIMGRGIDAFAYDFSLIPDASRPEDALVISQNGLDIVVDASSAPEMEGAEIDFDEERGGFVINNPNPVWEDEIGRTVATVIIEQINPGIAGHGGAILPVGIKDGVVYVRMFGGCQGCGLASVTLTEGVERAIKEAVPGITDIVDVTHHAAGMNPYYAAKQSG